MVYDDIVDFPKNYKGPKLSGIITGGGYSFMSMMQYPGSSAVIENITIPYGEKTIEDLIGHVDNFVCPETNHKYIDAMNGVPGITRFVVSAKLTTNRPRKGTNECVITIADDLTSEKSWLISFNKLPDEAFAHKVTYDTKRFLEDQQIGMILCNLLLSKTNILDHTMFGDGPTGRITSIATLKAL